MDGTDSLPGEKMMYAMGGLRLMLVRRMTVKPEHITQEAAAPSVCLWYAYSADLAKRKAADACAALLNEEEKDEAARFHFAQQRHEYLAAHALTRMALSHAYPLSPWDWKFSFNEHGKPSLIQNYGLSFSHTHSMGLAACLVASFAPAVKLADPDTQMDAQKPKCNEGGDGTTRGTSIEVGVDAGSMSRVGEVLSRAANVFSPAEREQLDALPEKDRPARAMSLWTLKAAYIKARGARLSLPLLRISFLFGGDKGAELKTDPEIDANPGRWRFCLLRHGSHIVALAVETPVAPHLEIFEARPPTAPPALLSSGLDAWFPATPA